MIEIYNEKLKMLHPAFEEKYNKWLYNGKDRVIFCSEDFNRKYNDLRLVIGFIKIGKKSGEFYQTVRDR